MAGDEQWVNLPKQGKYVEDDIASQERLEAVHVEAGFEKASPAGFWVNVTPVGDHVRYSTGERGRNPNFRVRILGKATNDGAKKVKLEKDIFLTAAGGNEYKVQAKYKRKEVQSEKVLKVRRKLFYQVMRMRSITAATTATMIRAYWKPDKKFFIKMKKMGANAEIAYQKNVGENVASHNAFIAAAARKWTLAGRKPYCFAVAFVDYIAKPGDTIVRDQVHLDVPGKLVNIRWGAEMTIQLNQFLWFGLVPADDRAKRWLIDGKFIFKPDGTAPGVQEVIHFNRNDVAIAGPDYRPHGGKARVKVRLHGTAIDRNLFTSRKGTWHVELKLRTADGWSNGFSYNNYNLVAIADKAVWRDETAAVKAYTINHEVGHKIGMVATGKGRAPDPPASIYGQNRGVNDRDHCGPHCGKGASWDGTKPRGRRWSGIPKCVMFGADGVTDAAGVYHAAPSTYCSDCAKAVRKLDLSGNTLRMGGFKVSLDEV